MITITIDREHLSMESRGHAKAEKNAFGHDLVCCAVSALLQGYVYAGTRTGHIMEYDSEKGHLVARHDPDTNGSERLRNIYDGYVWGLQLVAENYPENVRLIDG